MMWEWVEDDWHPDTQVAGALEPPRRRPPIAIATGGPPPREPDDPDEIGGELEDDGEPYLEPGRIRLVALRLATIGLLLLAAYFLQPLGWRAFAGAGVVALAQAAWHRARRESGRGRAPSQDDLGEPPARAA